MVTGNFDLDSGGAVRNLPVSKEAVFTRNVGEAIECVRAAGAGVELRGAAH